MVNATQGANTNDSINGATLSTGAAGHPAKILVVEDDLNLAKMITEYLTWLGFHARQVNTGQQACELLIRQAMDLVLLDVELPDISGLHICRWIRDHAELRHLPVIFCTGSLVVPADLINIEAELIHKPFQMETLMEAVQRNLPHRLPATLAPG